MFYIEAIQSIHLLKQKIGELRAAVTGFPKSVVGFVPTMGFLHKGHVSLIEVAKAQCNIVVLSIFVNPLQFRANEDLDKYPRDIERDLQIAEQAGVDLIFLPQVEEMYPKPTKTKVVVSELTNRLCGPSRVGHFDGVATVVMKLFHIVQPDKAYFGLKDAQQVTVLSRMVEDLNMDVEIVPCPILREADGLAMSSRNVYLNEVERKQALILSQALFQAKDWFDNNPYITNLELSVRIREIIETSPLAKIDYVEILTYPSLNEVNILGGTESILIALAVFFGRTRLIDNILCMK